MRSFKPIKKDELSLAMWLSVLALCLIILFGSGFPEGSRAIFEIFK